MHNLGQFLTTYALEHDGRTAYEIRRGFRTQQVSFTDVYTLAAKTATFLQRCSLERGDTLAIWSPNMPEYPILYFGCWLLGVVAVPIDVRTTEETLRLFVTKARCTLGFKSKFVPGAFPETMAQTYFLEDLIALVEELPPLEHFPEVAPDDPAEIAFTSGTTGTPKGVLLTHHNFLANVSALCQTFPLKQEYRVLSLLPLSHAFEQVVDFLALFQAGIPVVYLERLNQITIIRALRKHMITSVAVVPQLLQLLMSGIEREIEQRGKQRSWSILHAIAPFLPWPARRLLFLPVRQRLGKQLQFFGCGSAPLNRKLAQKWEHMGIAIYEGYGATETTAVLTINTPSAQRAGSVGKTLPGVEIQIDPASHEIIARGPNISPGYFRDAEKTQQAFLHGCYKTGDIGQMDAEGYLFITGRETSRIVLPGGEKAYPEDIENKLNAHPLVRESCVVGAPRTLGERVHAAVITDSPQQLDEIIRQVNQQLSSHEQILEWSWWQADDFPRTPLLKIDRKQVADTLVGREEKREPIQTGEQDKLLALLAQVTHLPPDQIRGTDALAALNLDSLQRVELLSSIEQNMGVALAETEISAQTSVAQLRALMQNAETVPQEVPFNDFNYQPVIVKLRAFLQNHLVFPLHAVFAPIQVSGQEHLANVPLPAIFYFNHMGIMDALCALRALPPHIRRKLVIAATRDLWSEWRRGLVEFWGGGFPFDTRENVKATLEQVGDFLDRGFSILIAPEGGISPDGTLQPFKTGIGFMAVHMHVPVVPMTIDPVYREIFPAIEKSIWENIPKKRRIIQVKIGPPMTFSQQTPIELATQDMRQAMLTELQAETHAREG